MLRLNKMTDYAVVILARMAMEPQTRFNAALLAQQTGVSEPTVAKLLKSFARAQLVQSFRGAQGGYHLIRAGDQITVRQVVEAIDGPIAVTDCVRGQDGCCSAEGKCPSRGQWDQVNDAIIAALDSVTLDDMMTPQKQNDPVKLVQIA